MGFFGPLLGLVGSVMSASIGAGAQKDAAAMQWDSAKKQTAADNMRHALDVEQKNTEGVIDTRRDTQNMMNQQYSEVLGVLRNAFMKDASGGM